MVVGRRISRSERIASSVSKSYCVSDVECVAEERFFGPLEDWRISGLEVTIGKKITSSDAETV